MDFSKGENFNPPLIGEPVETSVIIKKKKKEMNFNGTIIANSRNSRTLSLIFQCR